MIASTPFVIQNCSCNVAPELLRLTLYQSMLMTGKLERHLSEIDQTAQERMERIVDQLAKSYPPPNKADDPLGWAAHMNGLTAMAEEGVMKEVVYG